MAITATPLRMYSTSHLQATVLSQARAERIGVQAHPAPSNQVSSHWVTAWLRGLEVELKLLEEETPPRLLQETHQHARLVRGLATVLVSLDFTI
jgi:predicted component of type VI protein secretion system